MGEKGVKNMGKKYNETTEKKTIQIGSGSLAQISQPFSYAGSCPEKCVWNNPPENIEELIFGPDGAKSFVIRFEELEGGD